MKIRRTYIGPDHSVSIEILLNRDTIKELERVVNEDLTNHVEITLQEIIDYYEQKPNYTLGVHYTNNYTIEDILALSIDCLIRLRAAELGFEDIDLPYEEALLVEQSLNCYRLNRRQ
jgi:hypothetical protein